MRQKNKKLLWGDKMFVEELEQLQAKRKLQKRPVNSLGELTKEMRMCPSYPKLIKELLDPGEIKKEMKIRFDRRRL